MAAATIAQAPGAGLNIASYHQVPETTYERKLSVSVIKSSLVLISEPVDWASLATLDLSQFDKPGGKQALAKQLFDAIQNIGKN